MQPMKIPSSGFLATILNIHTTQTNQWQGKTQKHNIIPWSKLCHRRHFHSPSPVRPRLCHRFLPQRTASVVFPPSHQHCSANPLTGSSHSYRHAITVPTASWGTGTSPTPPALLHKQREVGSWRCSCLNLPPTTMDRAQRLKPCFSSLIQQHH